MRDGRRQVVGVVDDDAAVRESLRFLLEASGFAVVTFESAGTYLAAADLQRISCLLLDQHMPAMTGLELLQRLRGAGQEIPVALMTGSPSAQLARRAFELGAATVLEKPLTEHALFAFVEGAAG